MTDREEVKELLDYMYNLERFGIRLGLKTMEDILGVFDNPHKKFSSVHVTGTNGKGSTSVFLFNALKESGKKVGLYTSPHLLVFNERIRINDDLISDAELSVLINEVKVKAKLHDIPLTFFEFTTTIMFLYFARKKVDVAVIEVGMGGRLDATNVISPILTVITNTSLEHTHILGKTIPEIAKEKAGIIKEGIPLVTAEVNSDALDVFEKTCKEKSCELLQIKDFEIISSTLNNQRFRYDDVDYEMRMIGEHQVTNACLAIEACKNLGLEQKCISDGIGKAFMSGRLDIVSVDPLIIMDGAHNPDGISKLCDFVQKLNRKLILVLAISKEKNVNEMTEKLLPFCSHVICSEGNMKPMSYLDLYAGLDFENKHAVKDPHEALIKAKELREDEFILVTGSLYFIGNFY